MRVYRRANTRLAAEQSPMAAEQRASRYPQIPNQRAQLCHIAQRADTAIAARLPNPMFTNRAR